MKRDAVGGGKDGVEVEGLCARLLHDLRCHERIIGHNPHLQTQAPCGHQPSNGAEANDSDGLAGELGADEARRSPLVLAHRAVCLR